MSREGVADKSNMDPRWLEAVELGEVDLTSYSVRLAGSMLYTAGIPSASALDIVERLNQSPVGGLAGELTPFVLSPIDESAGHREATADPTGVFDAISPTDRLLVATPFAALFAFCWLVIRSLAWAIGDVADQGSKSAPAVERLVDLVDSLTVPMAFVAAVAVSLGVRSLNRAMDFMSWMLRSLQRARDLKAIRESFKLIGANVPAEPGWDLEAFEGFLAEPYRARARATWLRCMLCERAEPFLLVAYLVALVAALTAQRSSVGVTSEALLWVLVSCAAALVVFNHHAANQMARGCVTAVSLGLGWNWAPTRIPQGGLPRRRRRLRRKQPLAPSGLRPPPAVSRPPHH